MADNLYGQGAQLLESSGRQSSDMQQQDIERQKTTVQAGSEANANLARQHLEQMDIDAKMKGEMLTISPQLALGLVKHTGDKSWLQAVGQSMRSDVYTALYTHGVMSKFGSKEFKVPVGDQVRTYMPRYDSDTNDWDLQLVGEGEKFSPTQKGEDTPRAKADRESREHIAKTRANAKGSGGHGKTDPQLPKDRQWLKEYDDKEKWLSSDAGMLAKTRDKDLYGNTQAFVEDNAPTKEKILKRLEQSNDGSATPAQPDGNIASDLDAIFSGTKGQ